MKLEMKKNKTKQTKKKRHVTQFQVRFLLSDFDTFTLQ